MLRRSAVTVLAVLLVVSPAVAAHQAAAVPLQVEDNETETETETPVPQQKNPAQVTREGNLSDVGSNVERRLAADLEASADLLARGEFNRSRQVVDDEYRRHLARYARLAQATSDSRDDRKVQRYRELSQQQTEYVATVREYNETRERYEAARQRGDRAEARRLARELETLSTDVERTGGNLSSAYASDPTIAETDASETVTSLTTSVTASQTQIRTLTFTETTLSATADDTQASFLEPTTVTGRLATDTGDPVANERVRIQIRNHTYRTRTDADGTFEVDYRPTTLPLEADSVTVRFAPRNTSDYLGSTDTVLVTPERVESTLSIAEQSSETAYDESFRVSGTLTAQGTGAEGVPLVATVDDTPVGATRTQADGSYSIAVALPANVSAGVQPVTVELATADRALTAEPASGEVTVAATPSSLDMAVQRNGTTVVVAGELTTDAGTPVPERSLAVTMNGVPQTVTQTGPDGRFRVESQIPAEMYADTRAVDLRVVYRGEGANVEGTTAATTLEGALANQTSGGVLAQVSSFGTVQTLAGALLSGTLLALVGGALLLLFQSGETEAEFDADPDPDPSPAPEPVPPRQTFDSALTALDDGDAVGAVVTAYAAVREELGPAAAPSDRTRTHWEFYAWCQANGLSGGDLEALESLTQVYEAVTFSTEDVSEARAETAIDAGERLIE